MHRRSLLGTAGAALFTSACGAPRMPQSDKNEGAAAVAFDLFTLFDPRSVDKKVEAATGNAELAATWKTLLFQYCFIRAAASKYVDFEQLVRDSLGSAAARHHIELSPAAREALPEAFTELEPWPDTAATLDALKSRGLLLTPLANYAPSMIERLLTRSSLRSAFDHVISTDAARTFKPDPRAYALAEQVLRLPRHRIAFAAFGGWDAAGGQWFGFPTYWVNRLGLAADGLTDVGWTGPDFRGLVGGLSS